MFRYRDAHGIEKRLATEAELRAAIRDSTIGPATPLAEGESGAWSVASRHPAYQAIVRRAGSVNGGIASPLDRLLALRGPAWAPVIGIIAIAVVGFSVKARAHKDAVERRDAYAHAVLGLVEGRMPPAELLAHPVPTEREPGLRQLWVKMQVGAELKRTLDSSFVAFGVTGFDPPEEWATPAYVRNAAHYPAVGRHWENYLRWDEVWGDSARHIVRRLYTTRAAEAELSQAEFRELVEAELPGLGSIGWAMEWRRQFADEAHRLHQVLVSSRGRAYQDRGEWWFTDPDTHLRFGQHVRSLERIGLEIEKGNQRQAERLGLQRTQDDAVPPEDALFKP